MSSDQSHAPPQTVTSSGQSHAPSASEIEKDKQLRERMKRRLLIRRPLRKRKACVCKETGKILGKEVCIFRVPEPLCEKEPEVCTSQLVALGPYHQSDFQLTDMQYYKAESGEMFRQNLRVQNIIDQLTLQGSQIKKCFRSLPYISYETLAMIMTTDGVFLLELLNNYVKHNKIFHCSASLLVHCSSGKKLPVEAILSDVLMMENQIPRFVLKTILSNTCSEQIEADKESEAEKELSTLFVNFCKKISPIEVHWPNRDDEKKLENVPKHKHLLDLLYQCITLKKDDSKETSELSDIVSVLADNSHDIEAAKAKEPLDSSPFCQLRNNMSMFQNVRPVTIFLAILNLFLGILDTFGIKTETMLQQKDVLIPSVSQLYNARIKIKPVEEGNRGTRYLKFDRNTNTLYLPKITLNFTSLVVFRNLVMYETMGKPDSMHFRRYTELMGAIVDTVEDLRLLRDFKVLEVSEKYHLGDDEILDIFNGMTGTMRSKDTTIDKHIKETNVCYNKYPVVRMKRVMRKYVYSSWRFLVAFATLLLILMMGLQTFCVVYSCPTAFGTA